MESIEASVAYKKTPQKQPQKKIRRRARGREARGRLARREQEAARAQAEASKPDESKKARAEAESRSTDPLAKFHHATDDDTEPASRRPSPATFNGNEYGWAPRPRAIRTGRASRRTSTRTFSCPRSPRRMASPVGCFHITPDGKIADTKFKEKSGDDDLETAAERAIDAAEEAAQRQPDPVPTAAARRDQPDGYAFNSIRTRSLSRARCVRVRSRRARARRRAERRRRDRRQRRRSAALYPIALPTAPDGDAAAEGDRAGRVVRPRRSPACSRCSIRQSFLADLKAEGLGIDPQKWKDVGAFGVVKYQVDRRRRSSSGSTRSRRAPRRR